MTKPWSSSGLPTHKRFLPSPEYGIHNIPWGSDDEDYHTQEDELPEQSPENPQLPNKMWDQMGIRARTHKRTLLDENFPSKRIMGNQRMNHLVRFAKRRNDGEEEKLERHKYTPEDLLAFAEVNRLNSRLDGTKTIL